MKKLRRLLTLITALALLLVLCAACSGGTDARQSGASADGDSGGGERIAEVKLDPENPVTITVWHYYNGQVLNAFEAAISEFNDTVGTSSGVLVEAYGFGNVGDLEKAVMASANKEIGSMEIPNIFASYADTAYSAEKLGLLADLSDYFSPSEQAEYVESYIEEGRIGLEGELRIFPVAKSTEVMMVNETDWTPFAQANGYGYEDISTMEGLAEVSEAYYEWSGGKAFFGRDSMANFFIIASKQLGTEIFKVENGSVEINADSGVMRRIWDCYYVPYISGYFSSYGVFRSDDAKVGDLIAYVGSTASAAYFPSEVTIDSETHPVTAKVLPAPLFEGAERAMVQQGAGMVVTKDTAESEYASLMFLKWFTEIEQNIEFAALSGYMPVKKEALDYDIIKKEAAESGVSFSPVTDETLKVAIEDIARSELYTNKAFDGGVQARAVLNEHLQDKCVADREAVLAAIEGGASHEEAVAVFDTDENFNEWFTDFTQQLNGAVGAR